jgi:uncharacterized protein YbjQ (UPF0145 family)
MAFTSDLSTSDFWLLKNMGYEPIAIVLGNTVYSMGVVGGIGGSLKGMTKGEISQFTEIMYNAREMALGRMKAEAEKLGADGVVGVKLDIRNYGASQTEMEIVAVGTAVKYTGKKSDSKIDPTVVMQIKSSEVTGNLSGRRSL